MSCMENVCQKWKCSFQQFSNEIVKVCPLCGNKVSNFFDEEFDRYSSRGDDNEEIDATE